MKFLVTGGAGFIGSHIVERLLKEGHFVRVLDNFSSGKRENLSFAVDRGPSTVDFELIEGDIRDHSTCEKACEKIDFVLHQAALRSVPKSMKDPQSYNEVNINGTLFMLQAAAKAKVKRFVLASSSSVYGDTSVFPEKEEHLPAPISPYALSKLAGEHYCRIFSEHFGLETVSLRYFNVFGPRQALDDEYAVVIPKFIHCILHDEQPPIFGNGKQSRDFTYIDNVVEANLLAATTEGSPEQSEGQSPAKSREVPRSPEWNEGRSPERSEGSGARGAERGERSEGKSDRGPSTVDCGPSTVDCGPSTVDRRRIFNVANGKDHTVLQLVDLLNNIIGKNIKPTFLPVRAGDVFRTCADISSIKQNLGFSPKVDFEQGLKRTVEYFNSCHK